ncbi:hypothetical protein [Billgrantia endophytica]|uniref:hypothetical protein n=1 Tax=Billgrantia endophytica TaxID=2033802 RepID=UPI0010565194|nr:hypothetical protein [Halomonas endophytica]
MFNTQARFQIEASNGGEPIYYKGKMYSCEEELFDDNNKVEGLTFNSYRKRLSRQRVNNQLLDRDSALETPLKRQPFSFEYEGDYYRSLNSFYKGLTDEDKDPNLKNTTFSSRVTEILNAERGHSVEDAIFIALNAKPKESLFLHIEHYIRNKIIRNNQGDVESLVKESINREMKGRKLC